MPNPSSPSDRPAESRPGPSSTPSDDTAHRDALRILLSRVTRGVLLPDEAALLRQHVETELAAGDKARRDLATMTHVARANGRGHSIAYQAGEEARAELAQAQAAIARVRIANLCADCRINVRAALNDPDAPDA